MAIKVAHQLNTAFIKSYQIAKKNNKLPSYDITKIYFSCNTKDIKHLLFMNLCNLSAVLIMLGKLRKLYLKGMLDMFGITNIVLLTSI